MKIKLKHILSTDCLLGTAFVMLVILIFSYIFNIGILDSFKHVLSDFEISDVGLTASYVKAEVDADTNLILVNIRNVSIAKLARLIDSIDVYNPKVIGIEQYIHKGRDSIGYQNLRNVLIKYKNIVVADSLINYNKKIELYDDFIRESDTLNVPCVSGYTNLLFGKPSDKFTVREFAPYTIVNDKIEYSFSVRIMQKYNTILASELLKRDNRFENIHYRGNSKKYFCTDANDILTGNFNNEMFYQHIVLLGSMEGESEYIAEKYFTPLNEKNIGKSFPDMYGIEVESNILSMMLQKEWYSHMPEWLGFIITIILVYFDFMFFFWVKEKYKNLYEIVSNLTFLFQSIVILYISSLVYDVYHYKPELSLVLIACGITVFLFELYNESIRPILEKTYKIIRGLWP